MSDDLRSQMAINFSRKTTDELLAIWVTNDRVDWSNTAFDVIKFILEQRRVELPAQNEPVLDHLEPDENGSYDVGILAEKAAHPKGDAAFYRPAQVLRLVQQLNKFAPLAVVATIVSSLPSLFSLHRSIASYFVGNPQGNLFALFIALFVGAAAMALQCWLIYFTLKSAAAILKILMEMEFNSRIGANSASLEQPA